MKIIIWVLLGEISRPQRLNIIERMFNLVLGDPTGIWSKYDNIVSELK